MIPNYVISSEKEEFSLPLPDVDVADKFKKSTLKIEYYLDGVIASQSEYKLVQKLESAPNLNLNINIYPTCQNTGTGIIYDAVGSFSQYSNFQFPIANYSEWEDGNGNIYTGTDIAPNSPSGGHGDKNIYINKPLIYDNIESSIKCMFEVDLTAVSGKIGAGGVVISNIMGNYIDMRSCSANARPVHLGYWDHIASSALIEKKLADGVSLNPKGRYLGVCVEVNKIL